jgi:phosphatidylglycerol:prolipoprotein diacylglycerol transferase
MHYFHPTFLYESLWNAAGFVLLHFLSKKRQYDGQIALGYALWYGVGRVLIEGLRTDSLYLGDFRVSQLLAGVTAVAAAVALFVLSLRKHEPEKQRLHLRHGEEHQRDRHHTLRQRAAPRQTA